MFTMKKSNSLLVLVAMLTLSGCGGVMDARCVHHLAVHAARPRQPLTVSIRSVRDAPFHSEQHLVTDAHGDATATFQSGWSAAFFVLPPLGAVPSRPPKPDYLVLSGSQRFVLSPATPDVQYRYRDGGWFTEASVHP